RRSTVALFSPGTRSRLAPRLWPRLLGGHIGAQLHVALRLERIEYRTPMKVLISGAGVAGPCLAYWLQRHGVRPTIVGRAPQLGTGGYIIDFWGAGFDVAERMGLVPQILEKGYKVRELRQVDRSGMRVSGFSVSVLDRITHGRYTSLSRSDLAAS